MLYPENQIEFRKMFNTELDCLKYLKAIRWPSGFVCPVCGSIRNWEKKNLRYECRDCGKETTVTSGTIFHRSTKPLLVWFIAIWWVIAQKNGVSAKGLQKILGLGSYQTAWTWLHKFRRLMVSGNRSKLSGIIEVDETLVGGSMSGKRGRGAEGKRLVVIAVEVKGNKTGRARLASIPDASSDSLEEFIKSNIEGSSTVITDGWAGYNGISKLIAEHRVHKDLLDDNEGVLPNAHRVASLLKRWLLGTHQSYLTKNKLDYYLDEYVFRYNRRTSNSRGLLFYRIIQQAVITQPITYKQIIENTGFD